MVRRPFFSITLAFASAVAAGHHAGYGWMVASAVILLCVFLLYSGENGRRSMLILIILISYSAGALDFYLNDRRLSEKIVPFDEPVIITGEILQKDDVYKEGRTERRAFRLRILSADGEKTAGRRKTVVYLFRRDSEDTLTAGRDMRPGDIVRVAGQAQVPKGRRNPGCFDHALYLKTTGVSFTVNAAEMSMIERGNGMKGRLYSFREGFTERIRNLHGEKTAALAAGILFGIKGGMDEEMVLDFQKNGTAHILAVSGLHVGIIYGSISSAWRLRKGKAYAIAVSVFFLAYAFMASFSISVVRAVIMVGMHLYAGIYNKRYDLISSAFVSALAILVHQPMALFAAGFQMSFIAVLSIAFAVPLLRSFFSGAFVTGIAVQIGLMPYMAYMFNYISAGALLINAAVVLAAGVIVPAGLCCMVFSCFSDILFGLSSGLLHVMCHALEAFNHAAAIDGVTVFTVTSPDIRFICGYYMCLLILMSEEGRLMIIRRRKLLICAAAAAAAASVILPGFTIDTGFAGADVIFADVGQGDCMHLKTGDGGDYMIDGGGSIRSSIGRKVLRPYLLKNGVRRLDGAFVTHLHTDHYKGIAELCREDMVAHLYLYEGCRARETEILKDTGMDAGDITYVGAGDTAVLSDDTKITVLWPERRNMSVYEKDAEGDGDENMSCLVMKIETGGRSIMSTGDVDARTLDQLTERYRGRLECDILKVPHHGSRYSWSEKFTDMCSPETVVIQSGKNSFGHPDEGVIEKYRRKGIIIYRNDKNGAAAFDLSSEGDGAATMLKGEE